MANIEAKLTVEIEVKNYEQVVKNDKGRLLGAVARVPKINSFIRNKVDQTIEEEVKKNLEQELPEKLADELTKGLREEGVQASVNVSIKRFYNLLITVTGKPCNGCKTSLKQETERAQVKEHLWRRADVGTRLKGWRPIPPVERWRSSGPSPGTDAPRLKAS